MGRLMIRREGSEIIGSWILERCNADWVDGTTSRGPGVRGTGITLLKGLYSDIQAFELRNTMSCETLGDKLFFGGILGHR